MTTDMFLELSYDVCEGNDDQCMVPGGGSGAVAQKWLTEVSGIAILKKFG